ncbi:MAG: MerR family transcriptional regulator [Erysipelotrichaceae bacterium]|nr:MerR family transcriptional regulator [Erysipelotrichaceae bacterium]
MKKYSVGQMAKALGVSTQTLRHYESLGLVKSSRNDDNQYRTYSLDDSRILFMINIYRSMGFSLPKIKEMLKEMTIAGVKESFSERIEEVEQEIKLLEQMRGELLEYRNSIQMAEEKIGRFWIENRNHEMVSVMKSGSGLSLENEKENQLVEYQKLAPLVRQGFIISKTIISHKNLSDYQYGVFMSKSCAEAILPENELSKHLIGVKGPLAKTIIQTKGELLSYRLFEPFFEWIEQQGYEIVSDLYGVVRYHSYYEVETTLFEFLVSVRLREISQNT